MQERKVNRKYDKQFKEEAVRLVIEGGRKVTEAARVLGYMRTFYAHGSGSIKKTHQAVSQGKGT